MRYLLLSLLISSVAFAADGEVGTSSTGTSNISVTIPERIEIIHQKNNKDPIVKSTFKYKTIVTVNEKGVKTIIYIPE